MAVIKWLPKRKTQRYSQVTAERKEDLDRKYISDRTDPGLLIFAGTTEGRLLAEYAADSGMRCWVSTATEYGKSLLDNLPGIEAVCGRMDEEKIRAFIRERKLSLVIDATHPFAVRATECIRKACLAENTEYVRCVRELHEEKKSLAVSGKKNPDESEKEHRIVEVKSVAEAVDYLKQTEGNILIATGSRDLAMYTEIPDYRKRCFARVLSTRESVEKSVSLGFEGKHLIAMQGPFSVDMNLAVLRQTEASYFVTKESGHAGGFEEKEEAAAGAGAVLIVIGRTEERGMSLEETKRVIDAFGQRSGKDKNGFRRACMCRGLC